MANHYKMYILIKNTISDGHAIVAAAHGPLSFYLNNKENMDIKNWLINSFRKVVCKVSEVEFEQAKTSEIRHQVMTEAALNNEEVAIVFLPQKEYPKNFKFYKLWK